MKRIIINKDTSHVVNIDTDFHCSDGMIVKKDLKKKSGSVIKTNKNKEFTILDCSFIDKYNRLKRGAQIITKKDIGAIIAYTGIGPESLVIDAGAGSGGISLFIAHLVKKVVTYDISKQHIDIVKKNKEMLELTNVTIKHGDVTEKITEKNADLFTLDIREPWKAIQNVLKALKSGGFCVVYCPQITQVQQTIQSAEGFVVVKTIELLEREWIVDDLRARPDHRMLGHTGFLCFLRKA